MLLRSHECITGNMGKRVGEFLASVSLGSALLKVIAQQLLDSVGKRLSNKILMVYIYSPSHIFETYFIMYIPFHTLTLSNGKAWWSCWVRNHRYLVVLIFFININHLYLLFSLLMILVL